ncbi:type I-F CRISPR-associated endonuclease Cas1f [Glaciecola sp. KUL10]|uniref:type I-F CRISPR-associated endonuclease Cas1f n=1 Tax=Glaciecola sp. (strain KUL10) TaxID=2161813 RepID=UPI000D78C4EE|nr:type I-F CRISPR-associated endonuclease Cas1f [Glaciecola sp. KUL10]GBL05194.1 CRISPR-associated protein Cas1 [Glaciecola sp. KUL10]
MEQLSPSDMKAILHSKRANLFYLEYCRVMQKDGRVLYLTESSKENLYYNIPIANTTAILLGNGTSITQAAMRMLTQAGVLVGFCGGGSTPLYSACEIEWLSPQSEYRPTEYVQGWMGFWFDENRRLDAAKVFQKARLDYVTRIWGKDNELKPFGFNTNEELLKKAFQVFEERTNQASKPSDLLLTEAQLTKTLYKYCATQTGLSDFKRDHNSKSKSQQKDYISKANDFLNHGNYLAYGLAATTLWVLGIPHGFAVMHGKTRRGALVFDVADLIKDAIVLPWAFVSASENATEQEFRQQILQKFTDHKALGFMFEQVKVIALQDYSDEEKAKIENGE